MDFMDFYAVKFARLPRLTALLQYSQKLTLTAKEIAKPEGEDNEQNRKKLGAVAPPHHQRRRGANRRACRAGILARALGLRGLSGTAGQNRRRQHAGRAVRYRRPHR